MGNLCAPGTHCNVENGHCSVGDNSTTPEKGFFCKAAWCSEGSVCCENDSYGLCGSPGTTCCESPGGVLNLCAPGSYCKHENGHCSASLNLSNPTFQFTPWRLRRSRRSPRQ